MKGWKNQMSNHRLTYVGVFVSPKFMSTCTEPRNISHAMDMVNKLRPTVPATTAQYQQFHIWMDKHHEMVFRKFPN